MMHCLSFPGASDRERGQGFETKQSTCQAEMQGSGILSRKTAQRSPRGWVEKSGTTVTSVGSGSVGRKNCIVFPRKEM